MSQLKVFLLPPLSLFILAAVGLLVARRRRKLGLTMLTAAATLLVLACIPFVSAALLISLQTAPALPPAGELPEAQAIVVLAADLNPSAPELGGATLGPLTLERVFYGARLARRSGLPLLVSGGVLHGGSPSIADLMKGVLEEQLGVGVRWTESTSLNTRQNAIRSAVILRAEGIERVLLVTHAWHMPRATGAFEAAGLEVVPAPMGFRVWPDLRLGSFLPSARSLRESRWGVHEWIGRVWYAVGGGRG